MQTGLIIIHQQRPAPDWNFHSPHWEIWTTCLRHIAIAHCGELGIGWESELPSGVKVYRDEQAYEFLLEVVSGLHSPLLAETEVFGQFKDFLDTSFRRRQGIWRIYPLMMNVIKDVKMIRQNFLTGLGGQSYGSISRKYLAGFSHLAMLGSGRLVSDILPWVAKKNLVENENSELIKDEIADFSVKVFCRSVERAEDLSQRFPFVELLSMADQGPFTVDALIVAAPISASWWKEWSASRFPNLKLVLDLRGESDRDPLGGAVEVIALQDFFEALETNRRQTERAVTAARFQIQQVVRELRESIRHRPFGWDDLCA